MTQDAKVEGSTYLLSLAKLTGQKIADIHGFVTDPFDVAPTFQLCHVILEDGTTIDVEGEHDFPYLEHVESARLGENDLAPFMD